jgi:hypothetical protein
MQSFGSILFLVFLILKLCHQIAWSWWWVTAPLWVPVGIALGFFIVSFVYIERNELRLAHKRSKQDSRK